MIKVPEIVKMYYPDLIWKIDTKEKAIYLTFDDGPTARITPWVLNLLDAHGAKATFFCVGKNVKKHPRIYKRLLKDGHSVGNHTYDHKKGWASGNFDYMRSVMKCNLLVNSDLFRPPYGKIKKAQIRVLKDRFRIIMWDVLSEDYNTSIKADNCIRKVLKQAENGSIVVFHDSKKAFRNLRKTLPYILDHFHQKGYKFRAIT